MSLAVACEAAAPEKSLLRWRMKLNPPEPQRDWVLGPDHRGSPRGEVRRGSEGEFCPCAPLRPWQEFQLQGFGGEPVQRAFCPPGRTPRSPAPDRKRAFLPEDLPAARTLEEDAGSLGRVQA